MTKDKALDLALAKIKSARCCHPNAVQELIFEAEEILEQARSAPVQEPVWIQPDHLQKAQKAPFLCRVEPHKREDFVPLYTTPPAAQRQWVDPNEKSQKQFLPHIGESVLFCHDGVTYFGKHTGGSFTTGQGITTRNFNAWECHWMYPPSAKLKEGNA